jgi:hypothetical protein
MAGRRRAWEPVGWATTQAILARLASLCGPSPQSASAGQKALGTKKFCTMFLIPEKFLQWFESCKNHRKLSVYQKIMYDLPKCSEKHALHFSDKSMHC